MAMADWAKIVLCTCVAASAAQPQGRVVQTADGPVTGSYANGTYFWRGIPYAAAPTGDKGRFRPPQPATPWTAARDATQFGATCVQMGSPVIGGRYNEGAWNTLQLNKSSEDCLFINVYTPATPSTDRALSREEGSSSSSADLLPVMVYLHAGEFRFGSSNDLENNWPYFANKSVILVTGNVRLGVLGFAALDSLRSRDPSRSTGNYGMQDQRAMLEWVQKSIQNFGGDPTRVTIFGESSGGSSVAYHLFNKKSAGLFDKVILESPGLTQSKTYYAATQNTQWIASVLTAAGSPNCSWPLKPTYSNYTNFEVSGNPLKVTFKEFALAECSVMKSCFLVQVKNSSIAELYGGGTPGSMSSSAVQIYNVSGDIHGRNYNQVFVKQSSPLSINGCMVSAAVQDLVVVDYGPPFGDTFETDAAAPAVDGVELKAPLAEVVRGTPPKGVSVLGGSNMDEGTEFMSLCPEISCDASVDEFKAWAITKYGASLGAKVPALYAEISRPAPLCHSRHHAAGQRQQQQGERRPASGGPTDETSDSWLGAMRSAGDSAILCRTRELLKAAQKRGNSAWWYYFTATPIFSQNMPDLAYEGAFHGAEVPFVFGYPAELSSAGERHLSAAMGCYWSNFATSGNPNTGTTGCVESLALPAWPALGDKGDAIMFTNATNGITVKSGLKSDQCDLFKAYP